MRALIVAILLLAGPAIAADKEPIWPEKCNEGCQRAKAYWKSKREAEDGLVKFNESFDKVMREENFRSGKPTTTCITQGTVITCY